MITLRNMRWPEDREHILSIDTSFSTGQIYQVVVNDNSFTLVEKTISIPFRKVFELSPEVDNFPNVNDVLIAEYQMRPVGIAVLNYDADNHRAMLQHIHVDAKHRRLGIGQALMEASLARAKEYQARCIWLETQDVNYGAIQFYKKAGFNFCGLDLSLDERTEAEVQENAIFFMKLLST
ncbi:MAG: GNAT family N-acetyltransferase [Anaerolineales bacterium]